MYKHLQEYVDKSITAPAKDLADLLLCLRYELDLDQKKMSKLLGTTQGTWSRYENGTLVPPADMFVQLFRLAAKTKRSQKRFLHFCTGKGMPLN